MTESFVEALHAAHAGRMASQVPLGPSDYAAAMRAQHAVARKLGATIAGVLMRAIG